MLIKISKLILFSLFTICVCLQAWAEQSDQDVPDTLIMGGVNLEFEEDKKDSYYETQDSVKAFFINLEQQTQSLATLGTAHIEELDDDALQYLGAVYLYCSVQNGVCPVVLDALLEAELISSKLRGNVDCPNLSKFWKFWLKNEMERRHEYLVKTPDMGEADKFKKESRPAYVRCKDTIQKHLSSKVSASNLDFFKERYHEPSQPLKSLRLMNNLLELVEKKVPNLYSYLGIKFSTPAEISAPAAKGKKGGKAKKKTK